MPSPAAEHEHLGIGALADGVDVFRVGHDACGATKFDLLGERPVGPQQHDHRSDPVERGNGDEHAGAGIHQHADGFTLAHADRQQSRHHGVNARL